MIKNKITYEVIKTKDPGIIKFILPLTEILIKKNKLTYTVQDFAKWLRNHIDNQYLGLWVCIKKNGANKLLKEEKKLVGYSAVSFMEILDEELIFIYHLCSVDKNKEVRKKLIDTIEEYSKQYGIKKLIALTPKKHSKAMCKIFNAKEQSILIAKEIK